MKRAELFASDGVLLVTRPLPAPRPVDPTQPPAIASDPREGPEIMRAVRDTGRALALFGHVDLGTGLATALVQIVADELDLPLACVDVVLGDTASAPNQGPTIASASIQNHAQPLRAAAAQARAWLVAEAALRLDTPADRLRVVDGVVASSDDPTRAIAYADLVRGRHVALDLEPSTAARPAHERRFVGADVPRVDIPAKATGACRACCTAASSGRRTPASTAATSSAARWSRSTKVRWRTWPGCRSSSSATSSA